MGVLNSIFGFIGGLGSLSREDLDEQREALRLRYVDSRNVDEATKLYDELHRYDEESSRRDNHAYEREHPGPPEPRHREHGWYLPNDD